MMTSLTYNMNILNYHIYQEILNQVIYNDINDVILLDLNQLDMNNNYFLAYEYFLTNAMDLLLKVFP